MCGKESCKMCRFFFYGEVILRKSCSVINLVSLSKVGHLSIA